MIVGRLMICRCAECGDEFYYDNPDKYVKDTDTGDYYCETCTKGLNTLAEKLMEKAFDAMPTAYRRAFAINNLTGMGDLCCHIEEELEG